MKSWTASSWVRDWRDINSRPLDAQMPEASFFFAFSSGISMFFPPTKLSTTVISIYCVMFF